MTHKVDWSGVCLVAATLLQVGVGGVLLLHYAGVLSLSSDARAALVGACVAGVVYMELYSGAYRDA